MATWDSTVNNNFYGLDAAPEENRAQIKFKSGRTIYHRLNSTIKQIHEVKLRVNDSIKDTNGKTEFVRFLEWYEGTNGSGTVPITLTDIERKTGTKNYYVSLGNWNGQKYKELSLTLEEC